MTERKKLKVNIFDKDYSLLVENEDLADQYNTVLSQYLPKK